MSEYYNLHAEYGFPEDVAEGIEYEPSERSGGSSPENVMPVFVPPD